MSDKKPDGHDKPEAREIFCQAIEITDPVKQAAFIAKACGGDLARQQQVESQVNAYHRVAKPFDDKPREGESTSDKPLIERPGTVIGPYKLRERIGEGGFGVVYVAEQERPVRRKVALKIIKPGMDSKDVIARFEAERQALALMDHPNVARVLDGGATAAGRPYFVMELVHGIPITDFCDKNKLPMRDRLRLFVDVCRAVQHAHQKGIIHRDLKPSNIMVTLHDGQPVAKVIDFGVSKALSQQLTEKSIYTAYGQMIGTPTYMSPEQAEMSGLGIDTRSDIYSLGVLLYELLTGKTPLDAERLRSTGYAEILRIIREEEPPRPSLKISTLGEEATTVAQHRHTDVNQLRRALRGELDWIVMKCLEKDRSRRYETATGLARDVERFLNDEPVEARPPSTVYRMQKFARKNRLAIASACALVLVLSAATVISAAFWWQAEHERQQAEQALQQAEQARQQADAERSRAITAQDEALRALDGQTKATKRAENAERAATAQAHDLGRAKYISDMNAAQLAWDENNIQRVKALLALYADYPERGFEWHYLNYNCQRCEAARRIPVSRSVSSVAFLGDRNRLGIGLRYGGSPLIVYDLASNEVVHESHLSADNSNSLGGWISGFRAATDGSTVIYGEGIRRGREGIFGANDDSTVNDSVWRVLRFDGPRVVADLALPRWLSQSAAINMAPNGSHLAMAITDGEKSTLKLWNTQRNVEEQSFHCPHFVTSLAVSPNSRKLAAGLQSGLIYLYDLAESALSPKELRGHYGNVNSLVFSDDGELLVTGGADSVVRIWSVNTDQEPDVLKGHIDLVHSVDISSDKQRVASGSRDGSVIVWDVPTRLPSDVLKAGSTMVYAVALSDDGRRVACGGKGYYVYLWELEADRPRDVIPQVRATRMARDASGRFLATIHSSQNVQLLDLVASTRKKLEFNVNVTSSKAVAFTPAGKLAANAADGRIQLYRLEDGASLYPLADPKQAAYTTLACSPTDEVLIAGTVDGRVAVWDLISRESRDIDGIKLAGGVTSAAFSKNGKLAAVGGRDGTVVVFELQTGDIKLNVAGRWAKELGDSAETSSATTGHRDRVMDLAFNDGSMNQDSTMLASGSFDDTIKLWTLDDGECRTLHGHTGSARAVLFSPEGKTLFSAGGDRTVKVWDIDSGRLRFTLNGHQHAAVDLEFSPESDALVSASEDGTLRIWRTRDDSDWIKNLIRATNPAQSED